jgi:DNA-binding CsgD family transcriptional regulator/tetratricopeptide (TPR) repeat protein
MRFTTRLVGRAPELAELEHEQRRAAAGEFRSVLVLADPGVGKTRLVREFVARKRGRALALSARAHPWGETASFAAWSEALDAHLRTLDHVEIRELCGGFVDDMASVLRSVAAVRGAAARQDPSRLRLLEGLALLFSKLAEQRPVVVFLDDAHLADASSWHALSFLAHNVADARVLVVASARPAELAENAAATDVVLRLEQEELLARLELSPLDASALSQLAEAVLDDLPSEGLVDWLAERSRGNALFALSLLHALRDEGRDLTAPALPSLPAELTERVRGMTKALDEPARAVLELLATLGRRVDLGDLVLLSGVDVEQLDVILELLVRSRLAAEEERGRQLGYEIVHPLIQDAIYQRIGAARRRTLHRLIGRTLRSAGRLGEAAPHFAQSAEVGDDEAIETLRDAVRQAEERGAYREALTILDSLVELVPAGDERWLAVLEGLAWQAEWVVDHRADVHALLGINAMKAIDALLEGSSDPVRRATVKLRLANFLGWGAGDLDEAERACTEARSLFEQAGDRGGVLLAENELAWILGLRGDLPAMETAAERVVEAAQTAGAPFAAMQADAAVGMAASSRGRFARAEAAVRHAIRLAQQEGKAYRATVGRLGLAWTFAHEGRIDEALAAVHEAKAANPAWRESSLPEWEAIVHWFAGDFPAALASAQAAAEWSAANLSKRRAIGVVFAALAAVEAAQMTEAHIHLARARRAYGDRDWRYFSQACGHPKALIAWQEGRTADALAGLRDTSARVRRTGAETFAALVLVDQAELAAVSGEPETATDAAGQLAEIAASIDRDLYHGLAALGAGWAGSADAAARGVELFSGSSCKAFRARAFDLLGSSLAGTDHSGAVEALTHAVVAFDACGAAWRRERTRERLRVVGGTRAVAATMGPSSLSPRERQVARLAADGLTAREIAERLYIGQRTVETHLSNAYAKLGVHSKLDLVRRASELALNQ